MADGSRFNKLLEYLGRPSAALRAGVYEAQESLTDDPTKVLKAFAEQFKKQNIEAPTGADIAERTGISDEYPGIKAAIATAADFADPTPLGKIGPALKGAGALGAMAAMKRAPTKIGKYLVDAGSEAQARLIRTKLAKAGLVSEDTPINMGEKIYGPGKTMIAESGKIANPTVEDYLNKQAVIKQAQAAREARAAEGRFFSPDETVLAQNDKILKSAGTKDVPWLKEVKKAEKTAPKSKISGFEPQYASDVPDLEAAIKRQSLDDWAVARENKRLAAKKAMGEKSQTGSATEKIKDSSELDEIKKLIEDLKKNLK